MPNSALHGTTRCGLLLAAATAGLLAGTASPADPPSGRATATRPGEGEMRALAQRYAGALAGALPGGWSVEAGGNVLLVRRAEPIEWYCGVSLPHHRRLEELKARGFVQRSGYCVRVCLVRPPTAEELAAMRAENERIARRMEAVAADIPREKGALSPQTPRQKTQCREYEELKASLHRLPDRIGEEAGAIIDDMAGEAVVYPNWSGTGGAWFMFYSADVKEECRLVRQRVESLFVRKGEPAAATRPGARAASQPARGVTKQQQARGLAYRMSGEYQDLKWLEQHFLRRGMSRATVESVLGTTEGPFGEPVRETALYSSSRPEPYGHLLLIHYKNRTVKSWEWASE